MMVGRRTSAFLALTTAVAGLALVATPAPQAQAATPGTVKVRVVQDYNANGDWDDPFVEPPLAGVQVRVTDAAGVEQDLTTDSDGLVTITGSGSYRIEAINPDPAKFQSAFAREKTGTAETPSARYLSSNDEFVTVADDKTVAVTMGFWDVAEFCQSNPLIVNACQLAIFNPGGGLAANDNVETLFSAPYRGNGTNVGKTVLAKKTDTGTVFGIGYQRDDRRIFSAAYAKRGTAYGPGGPGAIYVTPRDGGATSVWGTVPNAGTRAHDFSTAAPWRQDWDFAPAVGKESLGDLDVSEDGDDLQVINLNEKKLYVYDARAATMGAPVTTVDLSANPGCAAASDWRPGALAERHGVLYVGGVCSAESTQDFDDLRAIILTFDADTYAPTGTIMDQNLNARRTSQAVLASNCDPRDSVAGGPSTSFRPWNDQGITCTVKSGTRISDPQAWMDDIVVERNGDLIMAFRDRTGDQQMGVSSRYFQNTDGTGSLVGTVDYVVAGDINKACQVGGVYTLDINGACGVPAPTPGGLSGEFFSGDGGVHPEEAFGGLALANGERGVASSAMDPSGGIFSQGYFRMDRATGKALTALGDTTATDPEEVTREYSQISMFGFHGSNDGGNHITGADQFSKGQGMADMEVLCDLAPIQIGNRVWNDADGDGVQDAGEDGIAGVTVNLYDATGTTLIATTVTNSRGEYYFDSVNDDVDFNTDYVIRLDKPTDYTGSGKLKGLGLSDADQGTGPDQDRLDNDGVLVANYPQASVTTGNRGDVDHTIDFGFSPGAVTVGNYVWVDSDGDGLQEAGEPGLQGVVLVLTGPTGQPVTDINGDPVGPVTTDADGHYLFPNLPPLPAGQHYTVTIDQAATPPAVLAPYVPTTPGDGSNPLDSSTWTAESTDLTMPGAKDLTLDFGFMPRPVSVGNFVWVDTDGDGSQDPGEPGIPGVEVKLYGPDGEFIGSTTTDANGYYIFTDLDTIAEGEHYKVTIDNGQDALKPYVPTTAGPNGGEGADDSSTGEALSKSLTDPADSDMTLDFGFVPAKVSVGDYVWVDSDRDGTQDAGEPGIEGVVLVLTGPDGQPVRDVNGDVVGPVTTDANGAYSFDDLPVLPAGQHYTVAIDRDATSTRNALAGFEPTTEGADGGSGATDSSTWTAESGDLTGDGDRDPTLDFGFVKAKVSVGDYVWVDSDKDGLQDEGEPGIPGVVLVLTGPDGQPVRDVNGDVVGPVTTDANGAYSFDDLPPLVAGLHYTVTIDRTAASTQTALAPYVPTQAGAGDDEARDSSTWTATSGDLTDDGDRDPTLDFGFVPSTVSVGDYVWVDSDKDGRQDEGEPGIPGVVLVLTGPDGRPVTDVNGDPVGPVTTDADGGYLFTDLPPLPAGQHYTVSIDRDAASTKTALAPYTPTTAGAGEDRGDDSSTWTAESGDLTEDGDQDLTLDFGFVPAKVSVGDYVWRDTDKDGVQDAGEPGIQGIVLVLVGPDGEPVTDVDGDPVGPVTTDANGHYAFTDLPVLPAGEHYTVRIDQTAPSTQAALTGLQPTLPGRGGNGGLDSSTWSAESGNLTADGDQDLSLDFGFVPIAGPAITTQATPLVEVPVRASGAIEPVQLTDTVTIAGLGADGHATAYLYGPVASASAAMCTPALLVGQVSFAVGNGTTTSPAITVTKPGVYTWVVKATDVTGVDLSHGCGLANETTTVQRKEYGPVRIETGVGLDDLNARLAASKTRLGISSVGIKAPVVTVGVKKGQMVIPEGYRAVGWLNRSAAIDDVIGTTVIAGHVSDNHDKPMAFWKLRKAKVGKIVKIKQDGKVYRFKITKRATYSRAKGIPASVFSTGGEHRLVLVTCTDKVTRSDGHFHYRNNLVVTAVPVG